LLNHEIPPKFSYSVANAIRSSAVTEPGISPDPSVHKLNQKVDFGLSSDKAGDTTPEQVQKKTSRQVFSGKVQDNELDDYLETEADRSEPEERRSEG